MTHSASFPSLPQRFSVLMLAVGVVLGLCIFAGTFFAYVVRHNEHLPGSYLPGVVGVITFTASMALLNYFALPNQALFFRVSKALGIALFEVIVFVFLLLLIILNTFGS
jgi:hypothetical protein